MIGRAAAIAAAGRLAAAPGRRLLGIAGAPGAGKSRLAADVAAAVPYAVVVPMDGFHLPTADLVARGWVGERGTPRTFDAAGYVDLLRTLRRGDEACAPSFDRTIKQPVPDAIAVPAAAPLVITEGNYLLLDTPPWSQIRSLLDVSWFVEIAEHERLARLIARHVEFGRPASEARERATTGSDADTARLVAASRGRADIVVHLS